jgi:hypothetical protein
MATTSKLSGTKASGNGNFIFTPKGRQDIDGGAVKKRPGRSGLHFPCNAGSSHSITYVYTLGLATNQGQISIT